MGLESLVSPIHETRLWKGHVNGTLCVNATSSSKKLCVVLCACHKILHELYFQFFDLLVNFDVLHSFFHTSSQASKCRNGIKYIYVI